MRLQTRIPRTRDVTLDIPSPYLGSKIKDLVALREDAPLLLLQACSSENRNIGNDAHFPGFVFVFRVLIPGPSHFWFLYVLVSFPCACIGLKIQHNISEILVIHTLKAFFFFSFWVCGVFFIRL